MRLFLFAFVGFVLTNFVCASVTIHGIDSSYAGIELIFVKEADPFTGFETELGKNTVSENGEFSISFEIQETTFVYAYAGNKRIYLYAEPGKTYNVILPKYIELTRGDKLNPFFQYTQVHLATQNMDDKELNVQIRMFMDTYQPYFNKHIEKIVQDFDFEQLEKDIEKMEKTFNKSESKFFSSYREYKYGMLRFLAHQQKSKSISDEYFKERDVLYGNPAYLELFNEVYLKYFSHFSRADKEKKLVKALSADKSFDSLRVALSSDDVLQPDELLGMVALKCLHDEFYDDNYSRKSMLAVLNSFLTGDAPEYQKVFAGNIIEKVSRLLVGFEPPEINLYDSDSNLVSLEDYKGKFIYLNFCSCFSYSCLNEFTQLQVLYEKHNKYLEIISIVIDDDVQVMKDFVLRSGYSWKFLHFGNQPDILQQYDVRTFPTYFLIDHEGKLSMSPAATPNEAFEGRLFKELRAKGIL